MRGETVSPRHPWMHAGRIIMMAGLLALALCLLPVNMLMAQCGVKNTAFAAGENVEYDLYFDLGIIWKKVGFASLKTQSADSGKAYDIELLAVGNKTADMIYRLRDTLECRVSTSLEPIYYKKAADEGNRYYVDEAWYAYKDGVSHVSQKRTRAGRAPITDEHDDSRCIYDMLSIIARARNYDMTQFERTPRMKLPLATGRRVEEVTLAYLGRDNVKAKDGHTYRCLGFSILTHDKDTNKEEDLLEFYVTDDSNHLPVRIDFALKIGSAIAYLKSSTGTLYKFDSMVK